MAATSRVKLYCRALAAAGDSVRVMITTVSERSPEILNSEPRGVFDGIPFEYTTGTPVRPGGFLRRRFLETRGLAVAFGRLAALRLMSGRVVAIAYVGTRQWSPGYLALTVFTRLLRIPVVLDLCEVPWPLRMDTRPWQRRLSPLTLTSGAITVSSYLTGWANAEYASRHSRAIATEVPILVDVSEVHPSPYPTSTQTAIYAAYSSYDDSLVFVLDAMRYVWAKEPKCRLVVTGMPPAQVQRHLDDLAFSSVEAANVVAPGWVSRESLLRLYSEANVCLAPLFDDQISIARFPTKIGEYASAGRPIVTSAVGEVTRYLEDRSTAFVAEPGAAAAFGRKILEALSDPELAAAVGARARARAEELFDYRAHASSLHKALERTLEGRSRPPTVSSPHHGD